MGAVLEVGTATALPSELGDGDPMQGGVELAVAARVEPMVIVVPRPDRDGSAAVVPGEGSPGSEVADGPDLADDLGRGQHSAALQRQQDGNQRPDQLAQLCLQLLYSYAELPDPAQQLTSQLCHPPRMAGQPRLQLAQAGGPAERADLVARLQLVQVPAQPVLYSGAFFNQMLAVV